MEQRSRSRPRMLGSPRQRAKVREYTTADELTVSDTLQSLRPARDLAARGRSACTADDARDRGRTVMNPPPVQLRTPSRQIERLLLHGSTGHCRPSAAAGVIELLAVKQTEVHAVASYGRVHATALSAGVDNPKHQESFVSGSCRAVQSEGLLGRQASKP